MVRVGMCFELHHNDGVLTLDGNDVYKWIDENSPANARLARYVQKWCEYLNYPLFHNKEMGFEDAEYARIGAWLDGYSFAMNYHIERGKLNVMIDTRRYTIILPIPYAI